MGCREDAMRHSGGLPRGTEDACEDAWSRGHAKSRVYGETERRDPTYSYAAAVR